MPQQSLITARQSDALKVEALRRYFDFTKGGRPTAETVALDMGLPVSTVRTWLADNSNAEILNEIVPLWPNVGSARQYASAHVQQALETIVGVMNDPKGNAMAKVNAANFILALAGVRPTDGDDEKPAEDGAKPAVLLNLYLGGGEVVPNIRVERVVDAEYRELPRLADAATKMLETTPSE